jgi:hypothetical protein
VKPTLLLLVRSLDGAATALANVGQRRAAELGVAVEVVPLRDDDPLATAAAGGPHEHESVTAVVPVDFAVEHHEAWCLLCHLSLLRGEVGFSILVLGAQSGDAFEARQRALLAAPRPTPAPAPTRRQVA